MNYETPFACIANDNGLVSEILHVSPVFIRCGPPRRGTFAERRLTRARRSDARHEQRIAVTRHATTTLADRFNVLS